MAAITGTVGDDVLVGTEGGDITQLSLGANGTQINYFENANVSADGTKIVFSGVSGLTPGDATVFDDDIFVKDLITGVVTLVSTSSAGVQGNGDSTDAVFSPDGTKILFRSTASNLVAGDTNGTSDLFLKDLATGTVTRVSTDSAGQQVSGAVYNPSTFSPDGGKVAFYGGGGLVSGYSGYGVFIKDLATGAVDLVAANGVSPVFSADGGKIGFTASGSSPLAGDTNGVDDLYVKNLTTGVLTRVTTSSAGIEANGRSQGIAFSPDGTKVMFSSSASNLVAGDTNGTWDVFVKDLATGVVTRVSTSAVGVQANADVYGASFSPDGKVVFNSSATNLMTPEYNGSSWDIFMKDLTTGEVTRLSTAGQGRPIYGSSYGGNFSADGTKFYFQSDYPLFPNDTNNRADIFVKDMVGNGQDILSGGDGNDRLEGRGANDELHGGIGADVILGDDYSTLTADGADILYGDEGNDVLIGGLGADVLYGGTGADILMTGMAKGALTAGVASLSSFYLNDGGDDQLDGGDGVDRGYLTFVGRSGSIVFDNSNALAVNTIWVGGVAKGAVTKVESIAFYAGSGADSITGGAGDDALYGWDGADILDGRGGVDTAGYIEKALSVAVVLNGAADAIVTVGGVAEDTLRSIENVLGGAAADSLTGDDLFNLLSGFDGDDSLAGRGGADVLDGGDGADTAYYDEKVQVVAVTLNGASNAIATVGGSAEDTLRNIENIVGGHGGDALTGDGLANRFDGGDGADTLRGMAGGDVLVGGAGDDLLDGGADLDTASYASAASGVTVNLGVSGVQDTGQGQDTLTSIEVLEGSSWDDVLTGDGVDNGLIGGEGQDWLQGVGGTDVLAGGLGHDSVWGGAGDDALEGGDGDDTIDGGAGIDTVGYVTAFAGVTVDLTILEDQNTYGAGTDTLVSIENVQGSSHDDVLTGNAGANLFNGADGADILRGGGGIDTLNGGAGDDVLQGDAGADILYGEDGQNLFVYTSLSDSTVAAPDLIADFFGIPGLGPSVKHDRINLSAIDANTALAGDQAFHLGATAGHAGDIVLTYDSMTGRTAMNLYVDGDATADATILLNGYWLNLTSTEFMF